MTHTIQGVDGASAIDGRRQRTLDSRARIIAAMLELTEAGQISVSAELVAERANVGLRTVFRHFKDMDSLYREMSLAVEARVRAELLVDRPLPDWPDRLTELIRRRSDVFERITPFKRAEAAHRHRSKALEEDIDRVTRLFRDILSSVLPPELAADTILFETLDMLFSFETWQRLRREQRLDPSQARSLIEAMAKLAIAGR